MKSFSIRNFKQSLLFSIIYKADIKKQFSQSITYHEMDVIILTNLNTDISKLLLIEIKTTVLFWRLQIVTEKKSKEEILLTI